MMKPTDAEVKAALDVLEQRGRTSRLDPTDISRARAIGFALFGELTAKECAQVAMEALEQWNGHLSVACIDAIEFGQGEVERDGRDLHITLPDHWSKF